MMETPRLIGASVEKALLTLAVGGGRERLLLEPSASGGELDDHPVGDPLHGRAVVRPGRPTAESTEIRAEVRHERVDLGRRGCPRPVGSPSWPITIWLKRKGCHANALGRTVASVPPMLSARSWLSGVVATFRATIPPAEPLADELEELLRREVERHVRRSIGVHDDHVVRLVGPAQERASVRVVHRKRPISPSRSTGVRRRHGRVELDAVDLCPGRSARTPWPPCRRRFRASRPARAADRAGRRRRRTCPRRRRSARRPPPDGVCREPLVEVEPPDAVLLHDLDELVARLVLEEHSALSLHRARRDQKQGREPAVSRSQRRPSRTAPLAPISAAACQQRALRPDRRDRDESGKERAQQAADRRDRVQPAGDGPALSMSRIASRIANGATIPIRVTGGTNRTRTPKNEPIAAPAETRSSPSTERSRIGRATSVANATRQAAAATTRPSALGVGYRSASRPPSQ